MQVTYASKNFTMSSISSFGLIFLLSTVSTIYGQGAKQGCELPFVKNSLRYFRGKTSPILIKKDNIHYPENKFAFTWKEGDIGKIICPGKGNFFRGDLDKTKNLYEFRCKNTQLVFSNKNIDIKNLSCEEEVLPEIGPTTRPCSEGAQLKSVGFTVYQKEGNSHYKIYDVCFHDDTASVRYSEHKIKGWLLNDEGDSRVDEPFLTTGLPYYTSFGNPYGDQSENLNRFVTTNGQQAISYNDLNRGHLTASGDTLFYPFQRSTFLLINVAPQWQVINSGSWDAVEDKVRAKAKALNDVLYTATGVSHILQLKNKFTKQLENVYFTTKQIQKKYERESDSETKKENLNKRKESSENLMEVPKYFWKAIIHQRSNSGIAFISLNNKHATNLFDEEEVKQIRKNNICRQSRFIDTRFDEKIACVSIHDLKLVFKNLPPDVKKFDGSLLTF